MFLFADLALPEAIPEWKVAELDDENIVRRTTSTFNASKDSGIESGNPNSYYGSDETANLGIGASGESRILISFNNSVPSGDMVNGATLFLTCGVDQADLDGISIYSARIKTDWDETNVTWNDRDTGAFWDLPGADDTSDRTGWEPPFYGYDNNTFEINVTALAQDAVINSRSTINILLTAVGSSYTCHMSESTDTNSRPYLSINHQNGTHTNGGSLSPNFVEDGAALMDQNSFLLSAATNPEISWESMSGISADVQLSTSEDFKSETDDYWYYNTVSNASIFNLNAGNGDMTIPSGHELENSTTMYYRMRAVDSSDTYGSWETGYFHLPGHTVTEVGNYGQITIDFDDLGLIEDTFEDTFIDSSSATRNTNLGGEGNITIGTSSSNEQYGLMRFNLDDVGLHSNSSIVSANLTLDRNSYSGAANVSFHIMDSDDWTEFGSTWRKYDGTYYWEDGGRVPSMSVGNFKGDQSSDNIEVDLTAAIQKWIDDNNALIQSGSTPHDSLDLMLVASTYGIEESSTKFVNICSTDAIDCNTPTLEITYDWGSTGPPVTPTHLSPLDGHAVWNLTGHNLSGNTIPTLSWDGTISWSGDLLLELSTDAEYRNIIHSFDTSVDTEFSETDGNWSISGSDALDEGVLYHWRLAQVDSTTNHRSWWSTSSFLISALQSEHLQDNDHRLRLSHGNATTAGDAPSCEDTYIDSGTPNTNYNGEDEMQVSYNTYPSETSILMGCDLTSHLLPNGYAVKTATLKMRLADYPSGTPIVAAWESRQNNWTEDTATWATFDGTNAWGTSGAKGWEKSSLLDSESLGNSYSAGDWVEWDVTLAVQNAMRENRSVDLILGILGSGSGNNRDALFYPNTAASTSRPEISFVYVPGSDAVPSDPVPVSPLNGSWSVETGINPAPDKTPQLAWNLSTSGVSIGGWSIELDTTNTFDSPDLIMATSWNDNGFDITNQTFDLSTPLDAGNTWYWRVRATSSTNQIGNWSNTFNFLLPDITTWVIDSNNTAVELRHQDAMPDLNIPNFIDTWVADSGVGATADQSSSSSLKVGTSSTGENATGLLRIPLTELPNPQNAHISKAELNLYAEFGSDIGNAVSIHKSSVAWNTSANGTTYDGVNNWSSPGSMGDLDKGIIVDIQQGSSADWMTFDITEIVQDAFANGDSHISLTIVGSVGEGQTIFTSTDGSSNDNPWLNMTWTLGNASAPEVAANNADPAINDILWNTSGHALLPQTQPTFTWNHPNSSNVDDWRIFIFEDYTDAREGWKVYDSRESSTGWDLNNLTWTYPDNLTSGDSYIWFTQPITDNILGVRGNRTIFHIPSETGSEINATDAKIKLQQGLMVEALDYPNFFMDTYIDSGATNTAFESSNELVIGRSQFSSSTSFSSYPTIKLNWSSLPIPSTHEFIEADLTLNRLSGGENGQETIRIAVCEMTTDWNESATYNSPTGNSSGWGDACETQFTISTLDYQDNTVEFDITYAVQHAHASGSDAVNLGFWVVDDNTSDDWIFASSDFTTDKSKRPAVSLTWRTGMQWLPSQPTGLYPADESTLWNHSASRPTGAETVAHNWTAGESNETRWIAEVSGDPNFASNNWTIEIDFTDNTTFTNNGTWDYTNLTYTVDTESDDRWIYWRVRAEQNHRLGKWSETHSYRIPDEIGFDDGAGNNTVVLHQGSVFENTGDLPGVPDASIDSSNPNRAASQNPFELGVPSSGSGESRIILTFDLSEMPFPSAMTPTSALLSLYRTNVTGTSSLTISAHACDTFDEETVTWNTAPSCSSSEITRSTLLVSPEVGWQVWDITSLAQSNVANGNHTLSIMLKTVGTPTSTHKFYDNTDSDYRPKLTLDYVDNVDGVIPPAQPSLAYPADGSILYNTSTWKLESLDKPQLSWNSVSNATGYVVTIADSNGEQKYKSWEDPEINGTVFTFSQNLATGEVYSWWVQAINGSIPGPASSRSTFAIGSPVDHSYNGDHTWTYNFQTGNEIPELGHTNIRDSYIGSGDADTNHGTDSLVVGTDCEGANTECRTIFALDNSQVPLPMAANIHSAAIHLQVEFPANGQIDLSVHRLLTNAWTQSGSTWNSSSSGVPWATGGMTAGIDYEIAPISTTTIDSTSTSVWLDIGHENMQMNGDHGWIVVATTAAGSPAYVEFYSSESALDNRPKIAINYTDVDTVSISPSGSTTDADTGVQFSHMLTDPLGTMIGEDVEWSLTSGSSGSINSTGYFTPQLVGTQTIEACFGVICEQQTISVTPGAAVLLQTTTTQVSITADEVYSINAYVVDQHGNEVPGETISYTPSNGSVVGVTFYPYNAGNQTVTIGWASQTIDLTISVIGGAPVYYLTTGCEEVIKAGTTCELNWTLHDQFGNMLDLSDGGGITWTVGGGVFTESNGTYYAMTVGNYVINMTSTGGLYYELPIQVTHGAMASLEIDASNTFVTADEFVWLNTTRIDVMGNRLSVVIPQENWTVSDGSITAGQPAVWDAQRRGTKTLSASYAGIQNSVSVQVTEGAITTLILVIDSVEQPENAELNMTADDQVTIKVKAMDSDGNKWTTSVAWTIEHPQYTDQSVLQEKTYGSSTEFWPVFASDTMYTLRATYTDANITLVSTIDISVVVGDLVSVALLQPVELQQSITADQSVLFLPQLTDGDGNIIDSSIISYELADLDSEETSDITSTIVDNAGVWEASTVGNYSITAWAISNAGYNISEVVTITVDYGSAVSVDIDVIADTAKAGDVYTLTITGTDADGNTFLESVLWTKDNKPVPASEIEGAAGIYNWSATKAGVHTYKFRSPSGAQSEWTVTVSAHQTVNRIELSILEESVLQLESFNIEVRTFDAWENEIPVPPETNVKLTGRMTAKAVENGKWTITTLDAEEQTVTISVHNKEVSGTIQVDGTFMGFFEAGGTLYYAGGILAILVVIVLLVVIVMVLRSGSSDYDDDDDDDDDYDYDDDESEEPATTASGPAGPPPTLGGKEDWMNDYRVDEDNVEWGEDQDGNWWYRDPGASDWSEWAD